MGRSSPSEIGTDDGRADLVAGMRVEITVIAKSV
jgi:hypothetical protein